MSLPSWPVFKNLMLCQSKCQFALNETLFDYLCLTICIGGPIWTHSTFSEVFQSVHWQVCSQVYLNFLHTLYHIISTLHDVVHSLLVSFQLFLQTSPFQLLFFLKLSSDFFCLALIPECLLLFHLWIVFLPDFLKSLLDTLLSSATVALVKNSCSYIHFL